MLNREERARFDAIVQALDNGDGAPPAHRHGRAGPPMAVVVLGTASLMSAFVWASTTLFVVGIVAMTVGWCWLGRRLTR